MHIGLAGPIATRDALALLDPGTSAWPAGCEGAPLLATMIGELLRRGHRVSAFTLSDGLPLRTDARVVMRGPGFDLHHVPHRPRAWPLNGRRPGRIVDLYAFERRGLEAAIESARPDVVHAHWAYEFAWAALRSGLPHVVTCHDSPLVVARFERDLRHGAYRWLRAGMAWHVLRHARRVTTVSPYMLEQVQSLCRVPVQVIANPISEPRRLAGAPDRPARLCVLMVCNGWGPRKNGEAGLRAYALLHRRLPAVDLHLFGRGTEEGGPAWHAWHHQGAPGHVVFHGVVAHDEVMAAMAAGSLMLHPALEESFGAVLAEAMSVGLPMVAGRDSGAVAWVVGEAGTLVDVTRPEAMADAMLALLLDPATARVGAERGRERVRDMFSPAAVAALYEREYESAIAGAAPRPVA